MSKTSQKILNMEDYDYLKELSLPERKNLRERLRKERERKEKNKKVLENKKPDNSIS